MPNKDLQHNEQRQPALQKADVISRLVRKAEYTILTEDKGWVKSTYYGQKDEWLVFAGADGIYHCQWWHVRLEDGL